MSTVSHSPEILFMQEIKSSMLLKALEGNKESGTPDLQAKLLTLGTEDKSDIINFLGHNKAQLGLLSVQRINYIVEVVEDLLTFLDPINKGTTKEPNAGATLLGSPAEGSKVDDNEVEYGLIPKMKIFSGNPEEGLKFLDSFKLQTQNMRDVKRIASFGALCGPEAGEWFYNKDFQTWFELEKAFKEAWCITYTPVQAFSKAMLLKQDEQEHMRVFASRFEEFRKFFRKDISRDLVIDVFMENTREAVRKHLLEVRKLDLSWDNFLAKVIYLDKMEPRPVVNVDKRKATVVQTVQELANKEVKKTARKNKVKRLKEKISELSQTVQNLSGNSGNSGGNQRDFSKKNIKCFYCGKLGHIERECRAKKKALEQSASGVSSNQASDSKSQAGKAQQE